MKKEIEARVSAFKEEREGFAEQTCLIVAKNKKGKIVPLIIEYISEDNINILSFNANGYKKIGNIKQEALINNNVIKAVAGTNKVATNLSKLIKDELTAEEKKQAILNLKNISKNELEGTVRQIITDKLKQTIKDKEDNLLKISNESFSNKFLIIYEKENNERIYLNGTKKEEIYLLENPLISNFKPLELDVDTLINSEKVIGIYGNSSLSKELKKLRENVRLRNINLDSNEIEMPNNTEDSNAIQGILKNKSNKSNGSKNGLKR